MIDSLRFNDGPPNGGRSLPSLVGPPKGGHYVRALIAACVCVVSSAKCANVEERAIGARERARRAPTPGG